jgi:3-deoxy-manno-octulosonate cytidylyltransferase (CMP-KDO synthetase)
VTYRIVIPSRYASQRLPAKALADIAGKPLVVHVWERARDSSAQEVIVATDDPRIAEAVEAFGARVMMTSPDHASGTDRLAEVAHKLGYGDDAIVVNLQGDEPLVPPLALDRLALALEHNPDAGIATIATPIRTEEELNAPSVVKVVLDRDGFALYFSRAPIPHVRDRELLPSRLREGSGAGARSLFLRHLGLYAYRVRTLRRISAAPQDPLEKAESLEQLRALGLGIPIHVTILDPAPPPGVDTEEDLERVRKMLGHT